MTNPKIIAELRELEGKATQGKLSLDGDVIEGPYQVARFFMYPHVREECEADRRLFLLLRNNAASLLADSERLRLAVGALEEIAGAKELDRAGHPAVPAIARDTLAKIKDTP